MENIIGGELVYPIVADGMVLNAGISLRDYFAGQALIGIVSKSEYQETNSSNDDSMYTIKIRATGAYKYADAMIKERNK